MTAAQDRNRDWWIPWSFVACFGVVLIANGFLAYFAFDTWTGLASPDAYKRGLAYNRILEQSDAQKKLGWNAALALAPTETGRMRVTVELQGRDGKGLAGAAVSAQFVRPTHGGHDVDTMLTAAGSGRYVGEIEPGLPGQWDVRIQADLRGRIVQWSQRVEIP